MAGVDDTQIDRCREVPEWTTEGTVTEDLHEYTGAIALMWAE